MATEERSGFEFPCRFPIKIMGENDGSFEAHALALVGAHTGRIAADAVTSRPSRNGRYLAVTVRVTLDSRTQLDAIYRDLAASDRVLMAL